MRLITLFVGCLVFLLAGCDYIAQKTLKPGLSTVADVRELMGRPETIWQEPDGRQVYEYPRAPAGHVTYMVEFTPEGLFVRMQNVLVRQNFVKIQRGVLKDDVRRLLGRPSDVEFFTQSDQLVWSYQHDGPVAEDVFLVYFNRNGTVVRTDVMRDPQFDNS